MTTVVVVAPARIRSAPSLKGETLRTATVGEKGEVTNQAPREGDGHIWWQIRYKDGVVGWTAQAAGETLLLHFEREGFEQAVEFTLGWEGGYVNHPSDPGGETKYGISKRSYPHLDIRNLTREQVKEIYYKDYWLRSKAYLSPLPLAIIIFDIAVISGVARALSLRNNTPQDVLAEQLRFYVNSPNFAVFGKGWIRRTAALLELL